VDTHATSNHYITVVQQTNGLTLVLLGRNPVNNVFAFDTVLIGLKDYKVP